MSEGIHYDYLNVNREDDEEEEEEEEEDDPKSCSKSAQNRVCCCLRLGLLWHQTTFLMPKVFWVYESSEVRILF